MTPTKDTAALVAEAREWIDMTALGDIIERLADALERQSLELDEAKRDVARLDWLLDWQQKDVGIVDDRTEEWIYSREVLDAARQNGGRA